MNKTGIRTKLRDFHDKIGASIIAEMLDCDFCLSFWVCTCIVLALLVLGFEISLVIPFCATPLARHIL